MKANGYAHLPTYYRRLINVFHTKRYKSRICMNDSVKNKHHILYELKNIYFGFQSRIACAAGLGVTLPLLRRNSRGELMSWDLWLIKKSTVFHKCYCFMQGASSQSIPYCLRNIPKDPQDLGFNVTIKTRAPLHISIASTGFSSGLWSTCKLWTFSNSSWVNKCIHQYSFTNV